MAINAVSITGNLTRDPQLKVTQGGTPVLDFGVAVNERTKDRQSGDWIERANFFDVTVFGNRAEALSHFLAKGTKVAIHGRLHWSQWQAKDGSKRSGVSIIADEIDLMSRGDGRQAPRYAAPPAREPERRTTPARPEEPVYDDSIPF